MGVVDAELFSLEERVRALMAQAAGTMAGAVAGDAAGAAAAALLSSSGGVAGAVVLPAAAAAAAADMEVAVVGEGIAEGSEGELGGQARCSGVAARRS